VSHREDPGRAPFLEAPVVDDAGDVSLSMTLGPGMDRTAVFRRQGASWTALGDLANPNLPRIQDTGMTAGDGAGALEVVWSDLATKQFAPERRRWEGGVWTSPAAPVAGANAVNGPVGLRVGVSHAGTVAFSWGKLATGGLAETTAVFMPGWTDRRTVVGFVDVNPTDIDVDLAGLPVVTFTRITPRTVQVQRWSGTAWGAVFDGLQVSPRPEVRPSGGSRSRRPGVRSSRSRRQREVAPRFTFSPAPNESAALGQLARTSTAWKRVPEPTNFTHRFC